MRTIDITKFSQRPHEILLKADLLDKQIVDIEGRKVIRVNDVRLDEIDGQLRVVAVDVGAAGLVRRLGMEGPFRTVARGLRRGVPERYIDWEDVDPLDSTIASIRLRVPHARLAELHPADLADIIDQLTPRDRLGVLASLDDEALADVVEEMEPDTQVEVLEDLEPSRAADILEEMSPDDAADLVADLSDRSRDEILALMEHDEAEEVRDLLAFPEDSAGGLMTTEFVGVPATLTAAETIDRLRELEPDAETIYYVYVVDDDGRLVGVLSLRDLIVARPETRIAEVMIDEPVAVRALEPAESVAETIAHYNLLAVPVVDDEGRLVGHRHGRRRDRHGGARRVAPPPAARVRARGRRRPVTIGRGLRDAVIAAPRGIAARLPHVPVPRLRGRFRRRGLLAFLAVMGPGIIAGVAGNDAGGITTYSVMGAETGLSLLWIFPVTIVILAIVQEMVARLGVVTGQGLSDLIRERFGVRWTLFAMLVLLVANVANTVANFGGAAGALDIFGIPKWITVPVVAVGIWGLVLFASYRVVERVFLLVMVVFLAYPIAAVLSTEDWQPVFHAMVTPDIASLDARSLLLLVAVVGTTITPYMQFYLQSAVAEKGIGEEELPLEQVDAVAGSVWTNVIAIFIVVASAAALGAGGRRGHHVGRRRGARPRARRGPVRRGAVRRRPVRGVRAGGDDHAALHRVRDLRGVRLGERRRQALQRRPDLLRDLHARAGPRRDRGAAGARGRPGRDHRRQPEPAGPPAADRAGVHRPARQRPPADGYPREPSGRQPPGVGGRGRRRGAQRRPAGRRGARGAGHPGRLTSLARRRPAILADRPRIDDRSSLTDS